MVNAPPTQPKSNRFRIPEVAVARHPGVMLAPRELRRWIASLPLANPPRAADLLARQLTLLVRDPQTDSRLAVLLGIYQNPVSQLLEIVTERLASNPESAITLEELVTRLVELLNELACGHLRLANAALDAGKSASAETLYRAINLLENALHIERQHYMPIAAERWQLLLSIFRCADLQHMADQAIKTARLAADDPPTVRGLFYRALIIHLCDPHQQRPEHIRGWHEWIGKHTELLELAILPQGTSAIPLDIGGTLPPLTAARRGKPGPDMRYLVADGFLQQLSDDSQAPPGLHRALSDLLKGRKTSEQRQSPRQAGNHAFRLRHGIRNIHERLQALGNSEFGHDAGPEPLLCLQINQSKTGGAFQLQGPLPAPLGVGEPILVEAETVAQGGAAIGYAARIRRLVNNGRHDIEIGVEKLTGRLLPLTLSGAAVERARGEKRALLQQDSVNGQLTLLAPRILYRQGDSLAAESSAGRHSLRMQELLDVGHGVAYIAVQETEA